MKTKLLRAAVRVLGTVAVVVFLAWLLVAQPSCRRNHTSVTRADPVKLREHVETLSRQLSPRDWQHRDNLDRCSDYIARHFRQAGATVEFQTFTVGRREFRNVIGRFSKGGGPRIIVGAHYDACGEEPGADDNASGHNPVAYARDLACPALFMHGTDDPRARIEEGRRVYDAVPCIKQFKEFPSIGHDSYVSRYPGDWTETVKRFLKRVSNPDQLR
jgi:pimeloyl-ACP methyl ester carboxylesterase